MTQREGEQRGWSDADEPTGLGPAEGGGTGPGLDIRREPGSADALTIDLRPRALWERELRLLEPPAGGPVIQQA